MTSLVLSTLLVGCSSNLTAVQLPTPQPTAAVTLKATPSMPEGLAGGLASPCTAVMSSAVTADTASAASKLVTEGKVRYDSESNTVIIGEGVASTLAGVSQALGKSELVQELAPGEWLLSANLTIEAGASLAIAAPEVRWLKLRSDNDGFAALRVLGGTLLIDGTCISSWDPVRNGFDEQTLDGRSYVLARDGARMDIRRAELRNLGYDRNESYGVAWRLVGTSGEIVDSYLAYNWYGMYSYEVDGLVMRGNEVHHNVMYGLDPHTRSHRLQIENNVVHDNGKHGIVLAEECNDSVVRNNVVYNNLHHGIVVYQRSNNNIVEGNTAYSNGEQGININDSANTIVRNNTVYENSEIGIGIGQGAANTQVVSNTVRANCKDGIYVYSAASESTLRENDVHDNGRYGIYIKSDGKTQVEENRVFGNAVDVHVVDNPS